MISLDIIVEKPSDYEFKGLMHEFGFIPEFELDDPMGSMSENEYHPDDSVIGEIVLVIEQDCSSVVLVAHDAVLSDWVLPMGRMNCEETIEMAAKREAKEETGLEIDFVDVLAIYRITFTFKNCKLIRWHFLVSVRSIGGDLKPLDTSEIRGIKSVPLCHLSRETKSQWSKFWQHSLLSIYNSRLEDVKALLVENGYSLNHDVSMTDLCQYFSDVAPSGDVITMHEVFRNQWLLCHELVEIDVLKGMNLPISVKILHDHPKDVMKARVKAFEVELRLAHRLKDVNWILKRIDHVKSCLSDPSLSLELQSRLEQLLNEVRK